MPSKPDTPRSGAFRKPGSKGRVHPRAGAASGKSRGPDTGGLSGLLLAHQPASGESYFWLRVAPLIVFVLVISFCQIRSLDLWWHIETGEWILAQRSIPRTDPFSHTAAGGPWVSHEWLFDLAAQLVYLGGGIVGLVSAKALLITGLFALTAWVARLRGASAGMTLLTLSATYAICRFRFTERPDLVSVGVAVGFLLVQQLASGRPARLLWLPILEWVWVNVHGGTALVGWGLSGVILLDTLQEEVRRGVTRQSLLRSQRVRYAFAALLGTVMISFANPHYHRALFYGLLRTESPLDNKEFQSLATALQPGIDLATGLFLLFAASLALLFFTRARSVGISEWILLAFLLTLCVVFFRFRPLFTFVLAPSLAASMTPPRSWRCLRYAVSLLLSTVLMGRVVALERGTYFYRFGAGIHLGIFPQAAADFIERNGIAGRMFNSYAMGGYVIWRLWPGHKVFIDGREDVYLGAGVLHEYVDAFSSQERWQALVAKYGIDFAIVRYPESPPANSAASLDTLAFPRDRWALVYFDDAAVIYLRRDGLNQEILRAREIHLVQPFQLSAYLDPISKDSQAVERFKSEMQASLKENPSSFRAHFTLGMLAVKRGPNHLAEAVDHFERAVEINPDFEPAFVNLGGLYLNLGRFQEADRALAKALELGDNPLAREQLQILRRRR